MVTPLIDISVDNTLPSIFQDCNLLRRAMHARLFNPDSFSEVLKEAETEASQPDSWKQFKTENQLTIPERMLVAMTIIPHFDPGYYQRLVWKASSEFAVANPLDLLCLRKNSWSEIYVPSGRTFLYLMGGADPASQLQHWHIFTTSCSLASKKVIGLEPHLKGEVSLSGRLFIDEKWLEIFLSGKEAAPDSIKYWSLKA